MVSSLQCESLDEGAKYLCFSGQKRVFPCRKPVEFARLWLYTIEAVRLSGPLPIFGGIDIMASQKERPDNVPEENVYNGIHSMVILTYIVAIGGVAILIMNAG
jgi:hypothetical protein